MTYTPNVNTMSRSGGAYMVDQDDISRVLNSLVAKQSGGYAAGSAKGALPGAVSKGSFEGWKSGQFEFARRIAQITKKHAARHKAKFCWKHHSIGLLRRLALVVMVASILSVQYI